MVWVYVTPPPCWVWCKVRPEGPNVSEERSSERTLRIRSLRSLSLLILRAHRKVSELRKKKRKTYLKISKKRRKAGPKGPTRPIMRVSPAIRVKKIPPKGYFAGIMRGKKYPLRAIISLFHHLPIIIFYRILCVRWVK